ncbi:MAG: phosphonoacetaldehyde hydrolase [Nitratireductor sp.]|nr:phosphonoacetaldehyde hydrolase [Nitratireductor sp.]
MKSAPLPVKAVIFDWAGTLIDFGSFAPMGVFVETFAELGVEVSIEEARAPMGLPKRAHIAKMLENERIGRAWEGLHGAIDETSIDRIYSVFLPKNEMVAARYATMVPGALATLDWLKANNIAVATTTGYTRSVMNHVLPEVEKQGFIPDVVVCSDELIEGRPGPLGIYKSMVELGVYPPAAIIKVDDTEAGLAEGVSAGCITVGVTLSGNHAGKTAMEIASMTPDGINQIRADAGEKLSKAGADHLIDTVADLPQLIARLAKSG